MDTPLDLEHIKAQLLDELSSELKNRNVEPPQQGFPLTDAGNAELFADLYRDKLRYNHSQKQWLEFRGQYWQLDEIGHITQCAIDAARHRGEAALGIFNDGEREKVAKWARGSENAPKLRAMLDIARSLDPIATREPTWQQNPMLLQLNNGVYDLESHIFRTGIPNDMIFQNVGFNYEPDAKCPIWQRVISEIFAEDDDLIEYFQKLVGYSITGSVSDQAFYLFLGDGCNGKSLVMNTLSTMLGDYSLHTDYSSFELKTNQQSNDIARTAHSRLLISSELPAGKRLDEARMKAISGGDQITARFLYKEPFTFNPHFKIWIAVNTFPTIKGTDNGIWRRVRIIPFNVCFTGREEKDLDSRLLPEIPGIMNWAIEGTRKWQAEGLESTRVMKALVNAHRSESDSVAAFLQTAVIKSTTSKITAKELYEGYCTWAKENSIVPESRITFGQRLNSKGIKSHKSSGNKVYNGVSLQPDSEG